jgi:hypothetical protein
MSISSHPAPDFTYREDAKQLRDSGTPVKVFGVPMRSLLLFCLWMG